MPPRRNIYATMRLIDSKKFKRLDIVRLRENYVVFSPTFRTLFFWIGTQKSHSFDHGQKLIPTPEMKNVLKLYLRFNYFNEYFLYNYRGKPLDQSGLSKAIISIFGIGSGMIRKITISEKTLEHHNAIESLAQNMGHSVSTAKGFYLKK